MIIIQVLERFLNYVKIETTSNEKEASCPSSQGQKELGQLLVKEMKAMGVSDASMDEHGYVMGTIPANIDKEVPVIGFIAHMDTSPDFSGKDVNPRIVENYDGSDIVLNKENNIILSPTVYAKLNDYIGHDLVVTDGLTLLGADDKAGIAEIMTAAETILTNDHIKHGTIKICFTPDEEIGRGADKFDVKKFGAHYAYTMDGGELGELEYESFNADNTTVTFHGRSVHPGYSKDLTINSLEIAQEFHAMLPPAQKPQYTSGREGFYALMSMNGSIEKTQSKYLVRDHDKTKFQQRRQLIQDAAAYINKKYGEETVVVDSKVMYNNMGEKIVPVFEIVELALKAMEENGVTPLVKAIRGGTDGARLSFMGLPCPNIFAGGFNFHGKHEFIPVSSMNKATDIIVTIIEKFANQDV